MTERILITGGAGFVGSHLADALLAAGHRVTAFDSLEPQVHATKSRPPYLSPEVELVCADVRDAEVLAPLLQRVDVLFHLAAAVGVAPSMYEIQRFTDINALGTATLLELLANNRGSVRKLIVASSMSVYGEGAYLCPADGPVFPRLRSEKQLAAHEWELRCPRCGSSLRAMPTDEEKPLFPTSVYAIGKRDQEEMVLAVGRAYGIPSVALRFFNTYGSRQALSNPYTGIAVNFCARMLSSKPPLVFEDGSQSRDLVHVRDIAQACVLAMEKAEADYEVFNVGSGRALSVRQIAETLAEKLGWRGGLEVVNRFRAGDVRHCFADISLARERLGYVPAVRFEDGATELIDWVATQHEVEDTVSHFSAQLVSKGLSR